MVEFVWLETDGWQWEVLDDVGDPEDCQIRQSEMSKKPGMLKSQPGAVLQVWEQSYNQRKLLEVLQIVCEIQDTRLITC